MTRAHVLRCHNATFGRSRWGDSVKVGHGPATVKGSLVIKNPIWIQLFLSICNYNARVISIVHIEKLMEPKSMLSVDASSNPYQIWTASLMRWARKAPSPSDEGQAHRQCSDSILKKKKSLGCNKDGHILFASFCFSALGWSWNSIPMDPPFRWPPFWQIQSPWLGRNPHVFQVVSNSCPRRRPEHHRGFGQHGQLQPKACWTMELSIPSMDGKMQNMSQTTNQVTIAAFFRPTRIDRTKNTPAIQRVVSHLKKRDKTIRLEWSVPIHLGHFGTVSNSRTSRSLWPLHRRASMNASEFLLVAWNCWGRAEFLLSDSLQRLVHLVRWKNGDLFLSWKNQNQSSCVSYRARWQHVQTP